jgi:pyruvate/2-oxoglutarate/acetoin dehydrogenase E1 component
LMKHALNCDDPVIFLEHRELLSMKGPVPEEEYEIPFGQAAVVREGTDVTVLRWLAIRDDGRVQGTEE